MEYANNLNVYDKIELDAISFFVLINWFDFFRYVLKIIKVMFLLNCLYALNIFV